MSGYYDSTMDGDRTPNEAADSLQFFDMLRRVSSFRRIERQATVVNGRAIQR